MVPLAIGISFSQAEQTWTLGDDEDLQGKTVLVYEFHGPLASKECRLLQIPIN